LDRLSPPPSRSTPPRQNSLGKNDVKGEHEQAHRDLYKILEEFHDKDDTLAELWKEVNTVPEWVDWEQISRGQDVFYRYGGANLTGLAYQSLLGGMGAARVVETLARTGGFSTKVARRRLFETTQHILQVTKSLGSIQPGGEGWASTIRVRLLHAAVRTRIMKLAASRPDYYSVEKYGIPINDLDSIATIGTFSATLIWLSLPRQGIFLRQQEIKDYVALWRYVGYLIGSPTEPYSTPEKAKAMMESLLYFEIQPSETSRVLASNLIKSLEDRPPLYTTSDMLIASARWLNGNELCDALGLSRPSLYYWCLMGGQCLFFMFLCYGYRWIPPLDRRKIEWLKQAFWIMIVESKSGLEGKKATFEFKYVPEFSTLTEMDESEELRARSPYIERRNLRWLLMAVGVFSLIGWFGVKVAMGLLGFVRR
jgi:ER-bound oxygenase mpaB/B'/Rubber oxygenase, catalytic domain